MFAARARASLKPFILKTQISSLIQNREIASNSKRNLHNRFINGLRLSGNGVGIKLFHSSESNLGEIAANSKRNSHNRFDNGIKLFHSSSPQCYTSESDIGVKVHIPSLFSSLEDDDDLFSELGSIEKKQGGGDQQIEIIKLLTTKPEPEKTNVKKTTTKKKKKKKVEEASDSISKLKLFTEKPEVSWKTNGKRKKEANTSSLPFSDLKKSLFQVHESEAQENIISLCSEETIFKELNDEKETVDTTAEIVAKDEEVDCSECLESEEEACEDQTGMRLVRCSGDLDEQISMKRILAKDLDLLLHSIMYLEKSHVKA